MVEKIDVTSLRRDLIDEYISDINCGSPMDVMIELEIIRCGTDRQLLEFAIKKGIDLKPYEI